MFYLSDMIKCTCCKSEVGMINGIKKIIVTWLDACNLKRLYILKTKQQLTLIAPSILERHPPAIWISNTLINKIIAATSTEGESTKSLQ